jgi:succinate dehydrogenase / fumarate reductase flavoprotein subunit
MVAKHAFAGAACLMSDAYKIIDHTYDTVVVGAGGSGLRATMGSAEAGLKTACITKVFPTRSHTVAAQGGIAASLQTIRPTTGRGTCTIPSRDRTGWATKTRLNIWCAKRPLLFTSSSMLACRFPQRRWHHLPAPLWRPYAEYGRRPAVQRTCAAADRTGHAMLHALYQQSLKYDADFFIEYFALDLIMEDGECRGVIALCMEDGSIHRFRSACCGAGDRRLWPRLLHRDIGTHLHR